MINKIKQFFDKNSFKMLMVLTLSLSVISATYIYFKGYSVIYIDAASHLNITRRIIDNLIPGFAQLGGVWLPIPHLLMLPFIWSDFMWHSGLAGIIISMLAFIGCSYFTFKLVDILTNNKIAAFIGGFVIVSNPNMLYLQATPMGETLFLFFMITSIYFLAKWFKTENTLDLILTAFFVLLSSLSRYEGWILIFAEILVIALVNFRKKGFKSFDGVVLLFATFAGLGPVLWLLWSFFILGDPLYFMHSQFSASGQQEIIKQTGESFTNHNLWLSIKYYFLDMAEVNGWLLIVLTIAGLTIAFLKEKLTTKLLFFIATTIILFEILTLYKGITVIYLLQLPPFSLFNTRYGIYAIPLIGISIGYIFSMKSKVIKILVIALFFIQICLFARQVPITFNDPYLGMKNYGNISIAVANFIKQNYNNGYILTAMGKFDAIAYFSELPMKKFIHEGTQHYWSESLKNPSKYAEWVIMSNSKDTPLDIVAQKLYDSEQIRNNYNLAFEKKDILVYKRKK